MLTEGGVGGDFNVSFDFVVFGGLEVGDSQAGVVEEDFLGVGKARAGEGDVQFGAALGARGEDVAEGGGWRGWWEGFGARVEGEGECGRDPEWDLGRGAGCDVPWGEGGPESGFTRFD